MSRSEWAGLFALALRGLHLKCPRCDATLRGEYEYVPTYGQSVHLGCYACGHRLCVWVWDRVEGEYWLVPGVQPILRGGLVTVSGSEAIQEALRAQRVGRGGETRLGAEVKR